MCRNLHSNEQFQCNSSATQHLLAFLSYISEQFECTFLPLFHCNSSAISVLFQCNSRATEDLLTFLSHTLEQFWCTFRATFLPLFQCNFSAIPVQLNIYSHSCRTFRSSSSALSEQLILLYSSAVPVHFYIPLVHFQSSSSAIFTSHFSAIPVHFTFLLQQLIFLFSSAIPEPFQCIFSAISVHFTFHWYICSFRATYLPLFQCNSGCRFLSFGNFGITKLI